MENQELRSHILELYTKTKKRLGAAKICVVLQRDYGISISVGRVYRLMKGMQLPKMSTVKPKATAQNNTGAMACQNLLNLNFNPRLPNQVWASDITYIKTAAGFVYLCVIMDLFARKIIAFRLAYQMDATLVTDTLKDAVAKRRPSTILFHSNRGSQYTSRQFRRMIDSMNFTQSFSNPGHPWDNAVVEAFFKCLKHEELNRRSFLNIYDLKLAVFEYIHHFYNRIRPHSANNMMTPDQKEKLFTKSL